MKIIFLGVNGVLNSPQTKERWNGAVGLDPKNMDLLKSLVWDEKEVKLAIYSDWALSSNWQQALIERGINLAWFLKPLVMPKGVFERDVCKKWLVSQGLASSDEVFFFAEKDQQFPEGTAAKKLVWRVDYKKGLRPEDVISAVEWLKLRGMNNPVSVPLGSVARNSSMEREAGISRRESDYYNSSELLREARLYGSFLSGIIAEETTPEGSERRPEHIHIEPGAFLSGFRADVNVLASEMEGRPTSQTIRDGEAPEATTVQDPRPRSLRQSHPLV